MFLWCVCCYGCVCFTSLALPEDGRGVLGGAQPQARWCFLITGTKWLRYPRAPSGQAEPPSMTGSQLTTASRTGACDCSPRSWDVWFCLSRRRGRHRCTAGIWKSVKLVLVVIQTLVLYKGYGSVHIINVKHWNIVCIRLHLPWRTCMYRNKLRECNEKHTVLKLKSCHRWPKYSLRVCKQATWKASPRSI